MNSLFQIVALGDDSEQLTAVVDGAFDEIERVERLLSWRDARSGCARVNREAGTNAVLVDFELTAILTTCLQAWHATDGYFDITANVADREADDFESGVSDFKSQISNLKSEIVDLESQISSLPSEISNLKSQISNFRSVPPFLLDSHHRLVRFASADARLDFGGFGKGYALDRAAAELRRYGVSQALLDGGTSSVAAIGCDSCGRPWRVGLRNPFPERSEHGEASPHEVAYINLSDAALSCSATFDATPSPTSDLIDPHAKRPITESAACAVVCRSAAAAEILSTALVCMGKARAEEYTKTRTNETLDAADAVLWIDQADDRPRLTVLRNRREGLFE